MTRSEQKQYFLLKFIESINNQYSPEASSAMIGGWLAGWEDKEAVECQSEKSEVGKSSGVANVENLRNELESLSEQLNSIHNEILIIRAKMLNIEKKAETLETLF